MDIEEEKAVISGITGETDEHEHNFSLETDDETSELKFDTATASGGTDDHVHEIKNLTRTEETNDHTHEIVIDKASHPDDEEEDDDKNDNNSEKEVKEFSFKIDKKAIEQEKTAEGDFGFFEGFASTFGNIDLTKDIIEKGAFERTLKSGRLVKLLWQHGFFDVIGSVVKAEENDEGLFIRGRINLGTEKGREAFALLKAGDLDSMSIGFSVKSAEFDDDTGIRTINEIKLFEVSIVTEPANPKAVVTSVKSIQEANSLSEVENILKAKGFTKKECFTLISKIKSFSKRCDTVQEKANDDAQCDTDAELVKMVEDIKSLINLYKGKQDER